MPIPHELAEEFPREFEFIEAIERDDGAFSGVTGAYREINRRIHRIESLIEPASSEISIQLRPSQKEAGMSTMDASTSWRNADSPQPAFRPAKEYVVANASRFIPLRAFWGLTAGSTDGGADEGFMQKK